MRNLFVSGAGVRAGRYLKNSPSGNPKLEIVITFPDGEMKGGKTATDASIGYELVKGCYYENVTVYFHYTASGALILDKMEG